MATSEITSLDAVGDAAIRSRDDVLQLREWGTDRAFALPPLTGRATIGASPTCSWQLVDASRCLSRTHAELVFDGESWTLRDRASKNGVRFDGIRRPEMALVPGGEIGVGGLLLVAESLRTIELRGYVRRLLGWDAHSQVDVDLALRSLRWAQTGRAPLVLCGDDDLVSCARALHEISDDDQPFVICDPRRGRTNASARAAPSFARAMDAVDAAGAGTVCVSARRLPADIADALAILRSPLARVRIAICGHVPPALRAVSYVCISIPSVASRADDLDRIIDEYAADAAACLPAPAAFSRTDRDWVRTHSAASHGEIAKGTKRLVAVRIAGSVAGAAELLGMSHASLGEWLSRRRSSRAGTALIVDRTSNSSPPLTNGRSESAEVE